MLSCNPLVLQRIQPGPTTEAPASGPKAGGRAGPNVQSSERCFAQTAHPIHPSVLWPLASLASLTENTGLKGCPRNSSNNTPKRNASCPLFLYNCHCLTTLFFPVRATPSVRTVDLSHVVSSDSFRGGRAGLGTTHP